jgi:5'(3')-deoxyribonucleotidase
MKQRRFLLDCDGILSDFCSACFNLIEQHTGDKHTHEEVTHWDVFKVLGKEHLKPLMKERVTKSGWCSNFPLYEGAQKFVKQLQDLGEVVIVTSPMTVPHWAYERELWLTEHFGIPKDHIVHTEGKHYIAGDVFIDDADTNCKSWKTEYPDKLVLLWDAPYNRDVDLTGTNIVRVKGWEEALNIIDKTAW